MSSRRISKQSKKFSFKRRTRAFLVSGASIVIVGTFLYIASAISWVGPLTINAIQISGVDGEPDQVAIRAAALESLEGSYAGLFSRSNTLIYPKGTIAEKIKSLFPWVNAVSISRSGTRGLTLSVKEKDPAALVCTTLPDFNGTDLSLEDPGSCYFADPAGYIFKKAPSFSGNVYHRYYMPELTTGASSTDTIVGKFATTTAEFKTLEKLYASVTASGIISDAILMKPNNEYELYARNPSFDSMASTTTNTVVIYFTTLTSLDEQTSNLVSFWKHAIDEARAKKRSIQFDSIDVRYGANVFYRENK